MPTKSKRIAAISLGVMGTGFFSTFFLQESLLKDILQGGFEAGLVGGLADWFAVTALFRYPMGIPIPHTALIPANRQKITKALVSTLENEWLTKESIRDKLKQVHLTEKILSVAEKELSTDLVKKGLASFVLQMIDHLDLNQISSYVVQQIKTYLFSVKIKNFVSSAVDQFYLRQYDEKVLAYLLTHVEEWVSKDHTARELGKMALQAIDNIEADGLLQFALKSFRNMLSEEKIGNMIQSFILNGTSSLRNTDNANRKALLSYVQKQLYSLKENEKLEEEMENWKARIIHEWDLSETISALLLQLKEKFVSFIQSGEFMDTFLLPVLTHAIDKLKADQATMDRIESVIQDKIAQLIEDNHSKIGKLVQENLDRMDNETLIEMIEEKIGNDLQWIRVNGAVCGFLIGVVLVGVKAIF